jgi:glycosyltransferase involved in cell wall biosynthesis
MTAEEYQERYPVLKDKISIIPTGLNLDKFKTLNQKELRKKYELPESAVLILYVGRFEPEKRLGLLIEAFNELSKHPGDITNTPFLLLVGKGTQKAKLEKLVNDMNIKNVRFMDAVPHESIPEIMNTADVFALPSEFEGSPTVVREALACGIPVVATRVGNIPEVVVPGKTGELVDVDTTPSELSAKLTDVLKAVKAKTITKKKCIETVNMYDWNILADKIVRVYNEIR